MAARQDTTRPAQTSRQSTTSPLDLVPNGNYDRRDECYFEEAGAYKHAEHDHADAQ
jgi:hypothetical protein